jgi:predicted secreted hydrolase
MAHLAIVDETGRRFVARERLAREALGLAGATTAPLRVWVEDWSLLGQSAGDELSLTVNAGDSALGLELRMAGGGAPVLQGDGGLDRKGPEEGNASYYYSVPGLGVTGTMRLDDAVIPVEGVAWLDREWGTSALSSGIVGWDWFALQFEQGGSLMYYRLREADGSASAYSGGTLIARDGRRSRLGARDVVLEPREYWVSDRTLGRYPVDWRIDIPTKELSLTVKAWLPNQELDLSVRYWEGAVDAQGYEAGTPLTGRGYVELTGY